MTSPTDHSPDLRRVLADVAAGRLSPSDAAQALGDLTTEAPSPAGAAGPDSSTSAGTDVWGDVTDTPSPPSDSSATPTSTAATSERSAGGLPAVGEPERVVIRAVGHRVRVVGEPSVAAVSVDGPHVVRREGGTLTVASEGEFGASLDGFTLMRSRSVADLRDRLLGLGRELSIRVNPGLAVDIEVTAGSLSAERLPKLSQVRVTAGSAKVHDAADPLDLLVQAGSAKVDFEPTSGRSRLRVESGSLDVHLRSGSDVRVHSDVQAGRIQWHGRHYSGNADEVVIGTGAAVLTLEAVMGAISVRTS